MKNLKRLVAGMSGLPYSQRSQYSPGGSDPDGSQAALGFCRGRGATVFHSGSCVLSTARQVAPATKNLLGTGQLYHGRSASRKQMTLLLLTSSSIHGGISAVLGK